MNSTDPTETCSDGSAATANTYTTYVSADSNCVYTDPTDTTITCSMAVGDTSCTIYPITRYVN